jgi:hypothetical protein
MWLGIVISIIVIIILILWFWHYGGFPHKAFRDVYETFTGDPQRRSTPKQLYEKTIGYNNDATAKIAIDKATKKETMYDNQDIRDNSLAEATLNSFMLGDLYRFNVLPNTKSNSKERKYAQYQTDKMYNKTIARLRKNAAAALTIEPEYIVDRIEDYFDQNAILDDIRANIRQARVEAPNYFAHRHITNDPQNVHDSQVVHDTRNIYDRIRTNTQLSEQATNIAALRQYVDSKTLDKEQRDRIYSVLDVCGNNPITSLDATEQAVLSDIWSRVNSNGNSANRDALRTALIDNLVSCTEKNNTGKYSTVCTSGRCTRYINTLTLLDNDVNVAAPIKTKSILRNEILAKTSVLIDKKLTDTTPILAAIYKGTSPPQEEYEAQLTTLVTEMKDHVADTIRKDYPNENMKILEELITDAQAGIEY